MKTAIFTAATKSYCYAIEHCANALARSLHGSSDEFVWIIATDSVESVSPGIRAWESFGFKSPTIIETGLPEAPQKYKEESQLLIAKLQQACMDEATKTNADLYFSVESDIIVHPDAYAGLKWLLECPVRPKYDIAAATYFNGSFLCGRGTPSKQICDDFYEEEREIPEDLANELKELRSLKSPTTEDHKKMAEAMEKVKTCIPTGNIFQLNGKSWKRRGWLDCAYPGAVSQGAVLPTDWCGLGCTMWGRDVMELTNFGGYEGKGTQDLHLVWSKWHPAGKRIGCVVGVPAGHVKIIEEKKVLWDPFFVPHGEETCGHLRVRRLSLCN